MIIGYSLIEPWMLLPPGPNPPRTGNRFQHRRGVAPMNGKRECERRRRQAERREARVRA